MTTSSSPAEGSRFNEILGLVVLIWAVEGLNILLGHRLCALGIRPRSLIGLVGIPLAPFLHVGLGHTLANTFPLLILGGLVLLRGRREFWGLATFVTLGGGAGVWLLGRKALHTGASGVAFGFFGFLVARGWYERSFGAIVIAAGTLFLYGGMVWGILPTRGFVSWESHLFGLISGVLAAWAQSPHSEG